MFQMHITLKTLIYFLILKGVDVLHKLINQSCRIGNQNQMLVANYLLKIAEIRIVCLF